MEGRSSEGNFVLSEQDRKDISEMQTRLVEIHLGIQTLLPKFEIFKNKCVGQKGAERLQVPEELRKILSQACLDSLGEDAVQTPWQKTEDRKRFEELVDTYVLPHIISEKVGNEYPEEGYFMGICQGPPHTVAPEEVTDFN